MHYISASRHHFLQNGVNYCFEKMMKHPKLKNIKLAFTASCLLLSSTCFATTESSDTTAYVDSVHQWGAWELDIEPAAGGITQPGTQPMNGRSARVAFRTNSFSAIAPTAPSTPTPPITDTPVPTPPINTPPPIYIPPVTNISPSVPVPVGAP